MIQTETELIDYLQKKENIYLFGAGKRAEQYLYYLEKIGISVDGILVSKKEGNPSEKRGKPVLALDELREKDFELKMCNVVVALAGGTKKWLSVFCEMPDFKSVLFISPQLQAVINLQELKYRFEDEQTERSIIINYPKAEAGQGYVMEQDSKQILFRFPYYSGVQTLPPLLNYATREAFEQNFGRLNILPLVKQTGISSFLAEKEKIQMYVVTSHMDQAKAEDIRMSGYLPIQVGASLTNVRKGCITDHTGDHISEKNRDYCECTGLYWIWKNTKGQTYVGLSHYRRRLMLDDASIIYINEHNIDLVAAHPQFEKETIREFFDQFICQKDWQLLKQFVIECDESYGSYVERYEENHFYFPCNVALWKRNWFDRYCEFAFQVAEKIETYYLEKGIVREDRYMGYLFEQLSSLFIMRHYREMNVACTQIEWIS
ncbi:MAG: DUF4422 domain-containing protein [Lachnospiraceae bacterium]|jgi:hypothetical protein|nr:DUF4422 domain-containing protein [Lachnospiraceae bacterium]